MTDIFDIDNVSDLPDDVRRMVRSKKRDGSVRRNRVHNLIIEARRPISVSQIMASYHRMGFGTIRRIEVYTDTLALIADESIERYSRGLYGVRA